MKIKRTQITALFILIALAITGFVLLNQPKTQVNGAVTPRAINSEDAFLEEVHELQLLSDAGTDTAAALPSVEAPQDNVPVIELETDNFDMGLIPSDEITRKQLKIFNRGKAPLSLSDVTTSCACTQGLIPEEHRTIAPGGEGFINIIVYPARIRNFSASKVLTVFSNDPANQRLNFIVNSRLIPEFTLEPETLDLGLLQKGEAVERKILVRQKTDQEFEIKEATLDMPGKNDAPFRDFDVSLETVEESNWNEPGKREYEVTFYTGGNIPLGALLRYFYLVTNLKRIPAYAYKVEGVVESFYTLDPSQPDALTLVRPTGSLEPVTKTATIRAEEPVSVTDLQFDDQFLEVALREEPDTKSIHLDVTLKSVQAGTLEKQVQFMVNGTEGMVAEEIKVMIYGNGMRRAL